MPRNTNSSVYLVDASIYIFRAYFAIPDNFFCPKGRPVNALYGYIQFILQMLQSTQAEHVAVAYDESLGSCFRNDIYPDYKSSRVLPDEDLANQLRACKDFTQLMRLRSLASQRYEADDIIATLAARAQRNQQAIVIVSRDKDLGQLLKDSDDCLWDYAADKRINLDNYHEHFSVHPNQMVDFLSLTGDNVDDIPGIPGIGKKTAAALLNQFGTVEFLYENIEAVASCGLRGAKGIAEKLMIYKDQVRLAQQLVQLESNVPFDETLELSWQAPAKDVVERFLASYGLEKLLKKSMDACYWWKS